MTIDHEAIRLFQKNLPWVTHWIDRYLEANASKALRVSDLGLPRLPHYYTPQRLQASRVVKVDRVLLPPLGKMGLTAFRPYEQMTFSGITYKDTFFLAPEGWECESTYFHELVHVIQWEELKPDLFLPLYAVGLLNYGYRYSPLEAMAYDLQFLFEEGVIIPDLENRIRSQTRDIAVKEDQDRPAAVPTPFQRKL